MSNFRVVEAFGDARIGSLTLAGKTLHTPAVINHTRQGAIPHIVDPAKLTNTALHVYIEQFLDVSHRATENNTRKSLNYDFSTILNTPPSTIIIASLMDPARLDNTEKWPKGKRTLMGLMGNGKMHCEESPQHLMNISEILKPDIFLFGEPYERLYNDIGILTSGQSVSEDPLGKMKVIKKRKRWLDILEKVSEEASKSCIPLWISVGVDSTNILEAKDTSNIIAEFMGEKAMGFGLYLPTISPLLLGSKEIAADKSWSVDWDDRLKNTLQSLPVQKPKFLIGCYSLQKLIRSIQFGVDLFENSWIEKLTLSGKAILISFETALDSDLLKLANFGVQRLSKYELVMDMNDKSEFGETGNLGLGMKRNGIWRLDFEPLSMNCTCWTCKRPHSRAYINHLLIVNDMLAYVLLHNHNLHQLEMFMEDVRISMKNGTFEKKAEAFCG
jgi:hypothetical protein